ncbi:hypothetical protein [Candidatus Clostridium stratigraminis]|uniref:Uncharacterized protein n=1 Tax=Candidatus Clostridium stratigraminis TaxID=3381661 RepID=A0ABW8SYH3_9CLOT
MENMNHEICDYYEPAKRKVNKLCKYFNGDIKKMYQIERCMMHCNILEDKQLMEEGQVFRRVKGALRKK